MLTKYFSRLSKRNVGEIKGDATKTSRPTKTDEKIIMQGPLAVRMYKSDA